ncbi:MAG: hypothetical protein ACFFB2_09205 [Promethearchaeota archaeon]
MQEAKLSEDKKISYGTPIRLPCDGSSALIADLITNYIIDGRRLNDEFKAHQEEISISIPKTGESKRSNEYSGMTLESLLLDEFSNQKLSKTKIISGLSRKGIEIDREDLLQSLESLADQGKITKEFAVHSSSGTRYTLWGFF